MVDNEQTATQKDQVIFSARYSLFRVWFTIIAHSPFLLLVFYVVIRCAMKGDYMSAALLSLVATPALLLVLDSIFFGQLVFYQDRVVKEWHFLGQRTIYWGRGVKSALDSSG